LATEFTSEQVQLWKIYSEKILGPHAVIPINRSTNFSWINRM